MASKKSKTDLLVRIRYQNPLPPPPFPPKLLTIPTDVTRYASYDFLSALGDEKEMPMIVDAELGMPLEFGNVNGAKGNKLPADGGYWLGNMSSVCPDASNRPSLHEDDMALLAEPQGSAGTSLSAAAAAISVMPGTPGTPAGPERRKADVAWLRRTEYFGETGSKLNRDLKGHGSRASQPEIIETDDDRRKKIVRTFSAANEPFGKLQHPSRPGLKAAGCYEVLPNEEIWANNYSLIRFADNPKEGRVRPGESSIGEDSDPRLDKAIFRGVPVEDDVRIAYFLPQDAETAQNFKRRRLEAPKADEDAQVDLEAAERFSFNHIRDYESSEDRMLKDAYVFTFYDDGTGSHQDGKDVDEEGSKTAGGKVTYVPVGSLNVLKKRRPVRGELPNTYPDGIEFWNGISVAVGAPLEDEEKQARLDKLRQARLVLD